MFLFTKFDAIFRDLTDIARECRLELKISFEASFQVIH